MCRHGTVRFYGFFSDEKLGWWSADSRRVFFIELDRGAKAVRVVEINVCSGEVRVVFEEKSDTFIKLSHDAMEFPIFLPLPETNELIWFSERSGWGHLYLYDLGTGQLKKTLTEGPWLVRAIVHVDIGAREAIVQTAGRHVDVNPYYCDMWWLKPAS